ncbi:DUF4184 family protein [Janthinobacterium sp. 17J80-10]|uniref:DUF4184 family protein n=1 Tax=Janthinobacterium sp. 17J80-10 TaxID=2497863 RepID=UPI0013E8A505|nr:DUF4184 family protein [Janthinobacterium sp. 17J80-10]
MPFTFAHPAAIIPLHRALRRHGVLSALIIGSMVPDFQNFLPFDVDRSESHSIAGMFWFCLPVGLLAYLLFHLVLERPLRHLLPPVIAARMGEPQRMPLPSASGPLILLSLLLGIVTHLAWDAFTHYSIVTVLVIPPLSEHLFSIGEYHVYPYKLLQHASTLAGTLLVGQWIWRGLQRPDLPHAPPSALLARRSRRTIIGILLAMPPLIGIGMAAHAFSISYGTMMLKDVVREAVVTTISSFGLLVIAYSLVWHIFLGQGERATR